MSKDRAMPDRRASRPRRRRLFPLISRILHSEKGALRPSFWTAAGFLVVAALLLALPATTSMLQGSVPAAEAANELSATNHQGELSGGGWSSGNITTYAEGDSINFRFTLEATAAGSGQMRVVFDGDTAQCLFFTQSFSLGTTDPDSGATPTVSTVGGPTADGAEWYQVLSVSFAAAGEAVQYYTLTLSDEAGNCSGSSTHTNLGNDPDAGSFGTIGAQSVPIPASEIIDITDITVQKTGDATVDIGGNIQYDITVTNNDPTDAEDVVITDTLPAGVSFVSGTWSNPSDNPDSGNCSESAGEVTCEIGDLAGDSQATATITVTVDNDQELCGDTLTNVVEVSTTTQESSDANNSAQAQTTVNPCGSPSLTLTKTPVSPASDGSVTPGQDFTYSIVVTNNGDGPATNLVVADTFNGGGVGTITDITTSVASSNDCEDDPPPDAFPCDFASLAVGGASITITVTIDVAADACGTITNSASVTSDEITTPVSDSTGNTVDVEPCPTTLTTTQSPSSATVGAELNDTATLSDGVNPTGTITFRLYPPDNATCTGNGVYSSVVTVNGNGNYQTSAGIETGSNVADAVGTWRWTAAYPGDANNDPASSGCQDEPVTVSAASPTLTTTPTPTTATSGDPISDTANLSDGFNPTGSITFSLFPPSDDDCSGPAVYTSQVTVNGNGVYDSDDGTETGSNVTDAVGTWRWTAAYSGDANNDPASSGCQDELVTVVEEPTGTITVFKVCDPADLDATFTIDLYEDGGQTPIDTKTVTCAAGEVTFDGLTGDHTYVALERDHPNWTEDDSDCETGLSLNPPEDIRSDSCTITNVYIPVTPTISSQVTAELINLGGSPTSVQDAVSVTDGGGNGVPGEVDFYLCFNAGAYPLCAIGGVLVQENVGLDGNGDATSSAVTPTLPGYYCFRIEFEPDDTDLFNPLTHLDPAAETECFQVTAPDVDVEKSDDPDPVVAGGTLTYTIVTTNNGTGPTNATITVVDNLPDGLTNVSVTENGWNCDDEAIGEPTSGAVLTCTYAGVVNAGANAPDIVISATVPVDDCDNLSNVVGVSGPDAQDDTDENTDTEPTDVDGCVSDLDITKSGDATALFGDTIEYLIEVFNDGNNIAEDVVVTDNLPDSLEGVTAFWDTDDDPSDSTACAVNAGNVVVCNVGDIGVGETRWVLITATIDDCADVVNQATVSWTDPGDDPGTDDDTEQSNDSNVVTTAVTCSSITIAKDTDPETDGVEFDFTGSFGGFTLEDGETVVFDELEPGVFSVTESDLPDGWNLTAIDCTNDDAGLAVDVDVDLGDETVLITLRPGEDVTCLFNNVFTPPVVVTEDETPTATPTPTTTPLVAEQAGVIVTPTPTSTLVAEVEQVRRLPTTGSGGPVEDELGFPWILAVALTTLAGGSLWVAFGRRGARTR